MKTYMKMVLAGWILACVQTAAMAQIPSELAEALTRKSGTWAQLEDMKRHVKEGIAQAPQAGALGSGERARLERMADETFAADELRKSFVQALAQQLTPAQAQYAMRWFDSPLGKKFSALEEAASASAQDTNTVLEGGNALLAAMSDPRRNLLARLVKATRVAEGAAGIQVNMVLAITQGVANAREDQSVDIPALRSALQSQRHLMVAALGGLMHSSFAWTYREVPDKELEGYLKFLETRSGQAVGMAMLVALDTSLTQAAIHFGKGIPKPMPAV